MARFADVWHCYESPQNFRELSAAVDELATAAGRDPASITRASSLSLSEPWPEVRANAEAMRAAGVGYLVCGWPEEGAARVEEFVAAGPARPHRLNRRQTVPHDSFRLGN